MLLAAVKKMISFQGLWWEIGNEKFSKILSSPDDGVKKNVTIIFVNCMYIYVSIVYSIEKCFIFYLNYVI